MVIPFSTVIHSMTIQYCYTLNDHSADSQPPLHRLPFPISSKGSFRDLPTNPLTDDLATAPSGRLPGLGNVRYANDLRHKRKRHFRLLSLSLIKHTYTETRSIYKYCLVDQDTCAGQCRETRSIYKYCLVDQDTCAGQCRETRSIYKYCLVDQDTCAGQCRETRSIYKYCLVDQDTCAGQCRETRSIYKYCLVDQDTCAGQCRETRCLSVCESITDQHCVKTR